MWTPSPRSCGKTGARSPWCRRTSAPRPGPRCPPFGRALGGQVRYLVPHLTSDLHLRKGLAQALRVPWFAVTVEPDSGRRLADTGARAVKAVVTTEDPLSAKRFAELLAQPGQVVQAMRLEGLDALPLELKQKPWASVVIHTKLEPTMVYTVYMHKKASFKTNIHTIQ